MLTTAASHVDSVRLLLDRGVAVDLQRMLVSARSAAMIRLAMNLLPSVILLVWGKKFTFSDAERRLWLLFAIISVGLFGVFLASPASTAIDRIALYMLPLQLVGFAQAPDALGEASDPDVSVPVLGVVAYYALVQFVWLNFADHAFAWVPYRFYPLEAMF